MVRHTVVCDGCGKEGGSANHSSALPLIRAKLAARGWKQGVTPGPQKQIKNKRRDLCPACAAKNGSLKKSA